MTTRKARTTAGPSTYSPTNEDLFVGTLIVPVGHFAQDDNIFLVCGEMYDDSRFPSGMTTRKARASASETSQIFGIRLRGGMQFAGGIWVDILSRGWIVTR